MLTSTTMRAFSDEATQTLEKRAVLGTLALGAGLHGFANLGYKALRSLPVGHRIEASQLASGIRHALEGKQINPVVRNIATYGIGPESLAHYEMGRLAGKGLSQVAPNERANLLSSIKDIISGTKHIKEAPGVGRLSGAITRLQEGSRGLLDKLPTVAEGAKPTLGQKALSAGLGAGAIALEPHAAIHMGINATRNAAAKSSLGKKFMKAQLLQGLRKGKPSRLAEQLTDVTVSPAALDTRRLGAAVRSEAQENMDQLLKLRAHPLASSIPLPDLRPRGSKLPAWSQISSLF